MHTRSITCFQSKQFCDQFPNLDWSVKHKVANLLCFCYYIYCDCCLNFGSIYALTKLIPCKLSQKKIGGQWILVYFSNIILICLIFFITAILHVWSLICNTYSVSNHFFYVLSLQLGIDYVDMIFLIEIKAKIRMVLQKECIY